MMLIFKKGQGQLRDQKDANILEIQKVWNQIENGAQVLLENENQP